MTKPLRPFMSYYGGKWRLALKYPAPVHTHIVEPFAGSAGYSLHYPDRRVILNERDPKLAAVWRYLLTVEPAEILALPDLGLDQSVDDLPLIQEARWLIGWWLNPAACAAPMRKFSPVAIKGMAGKLSRQGQLYWGSKVRERIATQVPRIRHWRVIEGDYAELPNIRATWFIDPPYNNSAGRAYREQPGSFSDLACWSVGRCGQVIVCENAGADWLPFTHLSDAQAISRPGKTGRSAEVVWAFGGAAQ